MPFNREHLTDAEVDSIYLAQCKELEKLQLRNLLQRIIEPMMPDQYDKVTRALHAVEDDWQSTKALRGSAALTEVTNGLDSG